MPNGPGGALNGRRPGPARAGSAGERMRSASPSIINPFGCTSSDDFSLEIIALHSRLVAQATSLRISSASTQSARFRLELRSMLAVDGGVKANNLRVIADAGADTFVAGSAIFGAPSYRDAIDSMRKELAR